MTGRKVLLTGASSGIGLAAARAFADAGCDVALVARNPDGLAVAAQVVRARGRRAIVLPCDVSDQAAVDAVAQRAER
ncbi:MAG TPA: SDR family NAD(P)-dependent oxidoreductase, partial [Solirubrobacteraceae bacterium]|nr:SDR family NAD(P)-dependent oxidoreductase [Solirubrobacteraceae bacterium]